MFEKFKLPALALGTALAIMSPGAALARDHDRDHERHERRTCMERTPTARQSILRIRPRLRQRLL
jgi:hypothetical protein